MENIIKLQKKEVYQLLIKDIKRDEFYFRDNDSEKWEKGCLGKIDTDDNMIYCYQNTEELFGDEDGTDLCYREYVQIGVKESCKLL